MTLNEWIKDYCEENEIELPEDIADNDTALNYLLLNNSGGGGGNNENLVKINCEYAEDVGWVLDKTFAELYDMCKSGKIVYFTAVEDDEFTTLDDTYAYIANNYTLSKVYKYDDAYRVCFNSCSYGSNNSGALATPSTLIFACDTSEDFPVYFDCITTDINYIIGTNFPW